jgi:hypothetical protein
VSAYVHDVVSDLNYEFFGAPHVAIITIDRSQGVCGAVDYANCSASPKTPRQQQLPHERWRRP